VALRTDIIEKDSLEVDMYKKVLLPLDCSELSEHAVEHLRAIALGRGGLQVILLYVAAPSPREVYKFPTELQLEHYEKAQVDAQHYLSEVAESLKKEGVAAETTIVYGQVAHEILKYVEENKVDLVVMSTHGRSGVARWPLGSVAERILCHSTVPVLIVPPHAFRSQR
jgi:nucleotide-binding universal stress UspA family protein